MTNATSPAGEFVPGLPIVVHLTHLRNVSAADATEYALGFLRNKATSIKLHYGVFAHGGGFIVEIHEGGPGLAYTPGILGALAEKANTEAGAPVRALLDTGRGPVLINCTALGLEAMLVPPNSPVAHDYAATPTANPLMHVTFDQNDKLKKSTRNLFGASLVVYVLAMLLSPSVPSISISPPAPESLPLTHWVKHQTWPANKTPVTLRLDPATKEYKLDTVDSTLPKND